MDNGGWMDVGKVSGKGTMRGEVLPVFRPA